MSHLSQPGAITTAGPMTKLFDSTLGADTTAIDTGANGVSTLYAMLFIYAYLRTSQAVEGSTATLTFNNDSGANYDWTRINVSNATVTGVTSLIQNNILLDCVGANALANAFSPLVIEIPNYANSTGFKSGFFRGGIIEDTAASDRTEHRIIGYRSASPISRVALTAGSGNLVTGTRLLIYGA